MACARRPNVSRADSTFLVRTKGSRFERGFPRRNRAHHPTDFISYAAFLPPQVLAASNTNTAQIHGAQLTPPNYHRAQHLYTIPPFSTKVEPFPDPSWKGDAQAATCRELPRIRSTGLEVGPNHGLGSTIYGDERDGDDSRGSGGTGMHRSRSWGGGVSGTRGATTGTGRDGGDGDDVFAAAARLRKGGKWLGELDVRLQLYAENPLLKRYP